MSGALRGNTTTTTGGVAGVTRLGAGIAKGLTGSAGANAGGLIFMPSMSINTGSLLTNSFVTIEAYSIMASFYGIGAYPSGYAIQPLNVIPISFSGTPNAGNTQAISLAASGSLVMFKPLLSISIIPSVAIFQLLAIVISGP